MLHGHKIGAFCQLGKQRRGLCGSIDIHLMFSKFIYAPDPAFWVTGFVFSVKCLNFLVMAVGMTRVLK